jgi:hypothetical protein
MLFNNPVRVSLDGGTRKENSRRYFLSTAAQERLEVLKGSSSLRDIDNNAKVVTSFHRTFGLLEHLLSKFEHKLYRKVFFMYIRLYSANSKYQPVISADLTLVTADETAARNFLSSLHIGPRFLPSCAEVVYTLFMTVS